MSSRHEKEHLKRLPDRTGSRCFGCGPENPAGLRLEFFTDGESIFSWMTMPEHLCGRKDVVHGGIICTILDEMIGRAVVMKMRRPGVTKALTIEFLKPVPAGKELKAASRVIETREDREAVAEARLFNDEGRLCAKSRGTFTLFKFGAEGKLSIQDEPFQAWLEKLKD